jgi:hypothetical protein
MQQIIKLDETCKSTALQIQEAHDAGNEMAKALILSRGTIAIRSLLTKEIMADVMQLQGSALGFKTDKDKEGGYSVEVVRDVLVHALVKRFRVTGNEFNIIAGSFYPTREGFERLLREFPGLTNLEISIGVPTMAGDGALVAAEAVWKYRGTPQGIQCNKDETIDTRLAIRVNKGMGIDAIIGKAKSKLFRKIFERLTGSQFSPDGDEAVDPVVDGSATVAS